MTSSPTPLSAPAPDGLPPAQRRRALVVIVLSLTMAVLDGTIVNLALPAMAQDLQASAAGAIWVVNAFQLAVLGLLLPLAALGDRIGYRKVYLGGIAVFTAASLGCALATSLPMLVGMRALQGMGAAGLMAVNMALVRLVFPRHLLGRGIAINSLVVAASSVAGPSVAAAVLSVASWPWLFAVNVPLGLLVQWMGRNALPANAPRAAGMSPVQIAPLDVLLNVLMFGLVFLGMDGLGTHTGSGGQSLPLSVSLGLLGAGLVLGAVYVRRQMHLQTPLLPLDLLRIPVFALSMCTSVSAFCAQMLAFVAMPFLLLDYFGRTPWEAGLLITAWPLGTVVMAPLAGRLIGRFPDGLLGAAGQALMACGLALLAMLPAHPTDLDIVWRMALCGIGFGLFQSPNNHTIVGSAPAHRSGAAGGMLGTARLTGQSLGAVLVAALFSMWPPAGGKGPLMALGLAAVFSLGSGLSSALRLRGQPVHG